MFLNPQNAFKKYVDCTRHDANIKRFCEWYAENKLLFELEPMSVALTNFNSLASYEHSLIMGKMLSFDIFLNPQIHLKSTLTV